ncbi:MAG TPA: NUDIX domain-containing protein [Gemmatirosa sp.]
MIDPSLAFVTPLRVGVVEVYAVCPHVADRPAPSQAAPSQAAPWPDWRVLVLRRAAGTRSPGSWETVHGRIEPGERPEQAAVRELREETNLTPARLYTVTTQAFYLSGPGTLEVSVAFCAFVDAPTPATLGAEHDRAEWLPPAAAADRFAWPRERETLRHLEILFAGGDAGPLEDVLRVRLP